MKKEDWKSPEVYPEEGRQIIVLAPHPKMAYPGSVEIWGGESARDSNGGPFLINYDDHGKGSWGPDWNEEVLAWCYAEDFKRILPDFIEWR